MRLGVATAVVALGLLAAGCAGERAPKRDTSTLPPSGSAAPAAAATDTLVGLERPELPEPLERPESPERPEPRETLERPEPPARDAGARSAARTPADTTPITATADELRALAAGLTIPVEGVRAADLKDSYAEARSGHTHEALDIHASRNTPVLSATDGRLVRLYESKAGGLMVYAADASDRFILMYGHLERYADGLVEGMPLRRGQVIAYVGTSGNAPPETPHLHFAIARGRPSVSWWRGTPVNPYPLLTGAGSLP